MKTSTFLEKQQCVSAICEATRKAVEAAFAELEAKERLNTNNLQIITENSDRLSAEIKKNMLGTINELTGNIKSYLKLIPGAETFTIGPTEGHEIIRDSKSVVNGSMDPDFYKYKCNIESGPTNAITVKVYELIESGDFKTIYGSVSDDLDSLCLTQEQIIHFIKKYSKWFRGHGRETFFLFKSGSEFFVSSFDQASGKIDANLDRFKDVGIWESDYRYRFVLPK